MQDSPNCGDQLSGRAFLGRRWRRQADVWWGRSTSTAPQSLPGTLWKPGVTRAVLASGESPVAGGRQRAWESLTRVSVSHFSEFWDFLKFCLPSPFEACLNPTFLEMPEIVFVFLTACWPTCCWKRMILCPFPWVHFVRIHLLGSVQGRGGTGLSSPGKQVPFWGATVPHPAQARPGVLPQVRLLMKPDSQCPFRGLQLQLNDQVGKEDSVGVTAQTALSPGCWQRLRTQLRHPVLSFALKRAKFAIQSLWGSSQV